jgi:hypothetical protein
VSVLPTCRSHLVNVFVTKVGRAFLNRHPPRTLCRFICQKCFHICYVPATSGPVLWRIVGHVARLRLLCGILAIVFMPQLARASVSDCPSQAAGNSRFRIVNEAGEPIPGATLRFTAENWDSVIIQVSDESGSATIFCVPVAEGYELTVMKDGYAVLCVTATATLDSFVAPVPLLPMVGRNVLVTHRGDAIQGVVVRIRDSNGTVQEVETDASGAATFARLTDEGEALFEVVLAGFVTQRVRTSPPFKNSPVLFDLQIEPVCRPMILVH